MSNIFVIGNKGLAKEIDTYLRVDSYYSQKYADYTIRYIVSNVDNEFFETNLNSTFHDNLDINNLLVEGNIFIFGIGRKSIRAHIINYLESLNVDLSTFFPNFYFESVIPLLFKTSGYGNVFCPKCLITDKDIKLGNFNMFNYGCNVSHDNEIGSYNVFSPNVTLLGHVKVGSNNIFGSDVQLLPTVTVGNNNSITAGITLRHSISNNRRVRIKQDNVDIF